MYEKSNDRFVNDRVPLGLASVDHILLIDAQYVHYCAFNRFDSQMGTSKSQ